MTRATTESSRGKGRELSIAPPSKNDWKLVKEVRKVLPDGPASHHDISVGEAEYVRRMSEHYDQDDFDQLKSEYQDILAALERVNNAVEPILEELGWQESSQPIQSASHLFQVVGEGQAGDEVMVVEMPGRDGKPAVWYAKGNRSMYTQLCREIKKRFGVEADSSVFFHARPYTWSDSRWIYPAHEIA